MRKFSVAALLVTFLFSGSVASAYDLPKLKPDKKVAASGTQKRGSVLKSDWKSAELFAEKLRARLSAGEQLAPNDPARRAADKNYVFIAFRDDAPYFLDTYSIKIRENVNGMQVWEQKIFPITKNFSPRNTKATHQTFCFADGKIYNSAKTKDALADLQVEADKIFLEECFKVGYYFAFGQEVHID